MILLDTHVWIWWVHGETRLAKAHEAAIRQNESSGLGVSVISCWEVAKLVQYGRLVLPVAIDVWMDQALRYPGVRLLELSSEIAVESTRLPGDFHRDPADQLIVATARVHGLPLLTADLKILAYSHVQTIAPSI